MSLLTTSAASMHQLGAAAAFAGTAKEVRDKRRGRAAKNWWSKREAIANAVMAGGWLIEQHTIRKHPDLDTKTNDAVRTKDVCVAGAVLTNLANVIASYMARRSPNAGRTAAKYERYFRFMRPLNLAFVAGAIGFTPSVNFDILKAYRPGTLYRLFT
jgi:hypothetical protein